MNQRQHNAERPNLNARRNKLRKEAQIEDANLWIEKVRQQATFEPQGAVPAFMFVPSWFDNAVWRSGRECADKQFDSQIAQIDSAYDPEHVVAEPGNSE